MNTPSWKSNIPLLEIQSYFNSKFTMSVGWFLPFRWISTPKFSHQFYEKRQNRWIEISATSLGTILRRHLMPQQIHLIKSSSQWGERCAGLSLLKVILSPWTVYFLNVTGIYFQIPWLYWSFLLSKFSWPTTKFLNISLTWIMFIFQILFHDLCNW